MRWDDSWGQADCDLDLVVAKFPAIQTISLVSTQTYGSQDGSPGSVPFAIVSREEVTPRRQAYIS